MILAEAIEFSKKFPSCHPRIFKGFVEWKSCDTGAEGYVVLTDSTNEPCSSQMEDYIRSHRLRVRRIEDYLMICTRV